MKIKFTKKEEDVLKQVEKEQSEFLYNRMLQYLNELSISHPETELANTESMKELKELHDSGMTFRLYIEDNKNNEESKSKIKSNNKINANLNLGSGKDNNILNKSENDSKKENASKKSNSEISDESLKKKKKKIVIEIINTDKQKNIVKKLFFWKIVMN